MTIPAGVYVIKNVASGTVLDLGGGRSADGTHIQGWQQLRHDSPCLWNQYWFIDRVPGQQYYVITNIKSGTVVDLQGGGTANGAPVQGYRRHSPGHQSVSCQEWFITPVSGGGAYVFRNKHSGTALDLAGGNHRNGAKVLGWRVQSGNKNQQWSLSHRHS